MQGFQQIQSTTAAGEQIVTKRTTADLIEELESEAQNFTMIALAVGFEKETKFVFGTDAGKLEKLNRLIERGGKPIGYLGQLVLEPGRTMIKTRPLEEYAAVEWVRRYLEALVASFGRELEEAKLGKVGPGEH
jgi:hypothetical protein